MSQPGVLAAVNPTYAIEFVALHGYGAFLTLGAVVLAVTGAEALYADMGHFGAPPIKIAWLAFVWPALILNYFGQGALLLSDPSALKNPFFMIVPAWGLYPMVFLATIATVIASQAVISGAYSVTQQALQLGFIPRLLVIHTSAQAQGQIYLPWINWFLLSAIIGLVLGFQSSSNMAAAYGIAVTGTMLTTTVLLYLLARHQWGWSTAKAGTVVGFFFVVDLLFFGANTLKIIEGGWFPLLVALVLFTVMSTWKKGRDILYQRLYPDALSLDQFLASLTSDSPLRVSGTAVYLTARADGVPNALLHNLKHNKVLHERVVILTIVTENVPRVPEEERVALKALGSNFFRMAARFGFMEIPDVPRLLDSCKRFGFEWNLMETSFFLNRQRVIPTSGEGMAIWRERLYAAMVRNAANATDFFGLPANRVIELGSRVEI
jgi:KUP system potassium uptake protein